MPIRWVALSGTPGVGKSSVATELRLRGWTVVDGNRFAREHGCIVGMDRRRRSALVELPRVAAALRRAYPGRDPQIRILESHWAHEVPLMDAALVLRLRPKVLATRLSARRWSKAKVRENLEAEALHVIVFESLRHFGRSRVGEVDMTRRSARSAAREIERVLRASRRRLTNVEIGLVDWTRDILEWF